MFCYNCLVIEVVWEIDGVEDVFEVKFVFVLDKVLVLFVVLKVVVERYWMVFNFLI